MFVLAIHRTSQSDPDVGPELRSTLGVEGFALAQVRSQSTHSMSFVPVIRNGCFQGQIEHDRADTTQHEEPPNSLVTSPTCEEDCSGIDECVCNPPLASLTGS